MMLVYSLKHFMKPKHIAIQKYVRKKTMQFVSFISLIFEMFKTTILYLIQEGVILCKKAFKFLNKILPTLKKMGFGYRMTTQQFLDNLAMNEITYIHALHFIITHLTFFPKQNLSNIHMRVPIEICSFGKPTQTYNSLLVRLYYIILLHILLGKNRQDYND